MERGLGDGEALGDGEGLGEGEGMASASPRCSRSHSLQPALIVSPCFWAFIR
jgi:hypothetical protein